MIKEIDPSGQYAPGVGLKEMEGEPELPEIRMGAEKYQVLNKLGAGGMGTVYLVYDRDLKRRVALKMSRGGNVARHARFLEESQVMGQLQHPNILTVHELGLTEARRPYYTMPVVRGRSLQAILDGLKQEDPKIRRTYSLTRLIQIYLQALQAISYAHDKGVIHRGIKPANIMLGEHGEVQVLDWGLAKVVVKGKVKTDFSNTLTREGQVMGTPTYMAPEQARGEDVDARTDIYALGVLLYEILTLERPYTGSAVEVMASVLREDPINPRSRAPEREIPLELERVCLKAMRKRTEERQQFAEELYEEVQMWLEAEADKAKRHERAEENATEGREKLKAYVDLKEKVKRLEGEAEEIAKRFKGWQPESEKMPLLETEKRLEEGREQLVEVATEVVTTLSGALSFERENASARQALADYYWDRLHEAELNQEIGDVRFNSKLVASYDDGRYAYKLKGDGTLKITSDPPGAEAWLYEYVEEGFRLAPGKEKLLGTTPSGPIPLPMGSYLVILKKEGFSEVRYPVYISRNRDWTGKVNLYTEEEVGEGYIYVPAGPFIQGGDPEARSSDLPRSEPEVDDFFIAEHPVTMEEYLLFLNEIAKEDLEAAVRRSPRRVPEEGSYLEETSEGLLKLPEEDAEGDRWDLRWPVFGISGHDAVAFCAWRSENEGQEVRLPTETEWEKAARGVDGRWYPWGNRFDASLCNMNKSGRERDSPEGVYQYPSDVSVYGVRGMGGNIRDWTATEVITGEGERARHNRVVRGGAWNYSSLYSRCARRFHIASTDLHDAIGFRVALSVNIDETPTSLNITVE